MTSDGFDGALDGFAFEHAGDDTLADMYGDDEHLGQTVEDWRDGETIEERNARIRARDTATRERDRPVGDERDPALIPRPRRAELRGGRGHVGDLITRDAATARAFVRERSVAAGFGADELIATPPRGRPTDESRRRRAALALIVAELREQGAPLQLIAAATRRPVSVVHELLSLAAKSEKPPPTSEGALPGDR